MERSCSCCVDRLFKEVPWSWFQICGSFSKISEGGGGKNQLFFFSESRQGSDHGRNLVMELLSRQPYEKKLFSRSQASRKQTDDQTQNKPYFHVFYYEANGDP
jgi:hypothetical protein